MKNRKIMTSLAALIFSILLLSLGCGGPPNTNTNQTPNVNAANTNSAGDAALAGACSGNDIFVKKTKVEELIRDKIRGDDDFERQRIRGVFKYQVETEPGINPQSLYVYLAGGIGNAGSKHLFHNLMGDLKGIHKLKCVTKVIFVPLGAIPFDAKTVVRPSGFEWFGCDTGTIACPGGICAADPPGTCPSIVGDPTPTPGSNSNSGSNANTNSNSNSNSNKPNP